MKRDADATAGPSTDGDKSPVDPINFSILSAQIEGHETVTIYSRASLHPSRR
jgi:hypothetical protein